MRKLSDTTVLALSCICILGAGIFGTFVRWQNLFHTGFVFDTVYTQYTWGKAAVEMGFVDFWKFYTDYLDYLPGAIYFDMAVYTLSSYWNSSAETFVTVLKAINWLIEIALSILVVLFARKHLRIAHAVALGLVIYVLPSVWFISGVWGQIDTLVALLSAMSVILLAYSTTSNTTNKTVLLSLCAGVMYGVAVWVKMQPVLLVPVIVLFFISLRNKYIILPYSLGLVAASVAIMLVPFQISPLRTMYVVSAPFWREQVISRSAASFWTLLNITEQDFFNKQFHSDMAYTIISRAGLFLYALFSYLGVLIALRDSSHSIIHLLRSPVTVIQSVLAKPLTILQLLFITTISTSAYFQFMPKMYARYLLISIVFAVFLVALERNNKKRTGYFLGLILMSLGNFINVVGVYDWWGYTHPGWLISFFNWIPVHTNTLSSLGTLGGLFVILWAGSVFKKTAHNHGYSDPVKPCFT